MRIVVKDLQGTAPTLIFATIQEMVIFLRARPIPDYQLLQQKKYSQLNESELEAFTSNTTHIRQTRAIEELISSIAGGEIIGQESSGNFEATLVEVEDGK